MIYQSYRQHIQKTQTEIVRLNKAINHNSLTRLLLIIGGGGILFYAFQTNSVALVCGLAFLIILLFAFLIQRQSKLEKQKYVMQAYLKINENEIQLNNNRHTIYDEGEELADGKHPYTSDLDIFGKLSLFSLVNRCSTKLGIETLAGWFKVAAYKEVICERQTAVDEIAADLGWSQDFQTHLLFNLDQKIDAKIFLSGYFKDSALTFGNTALKVYVAVAPFLLLTALLFSLFIMPIWSVIVILGLLHLCWTLALAGKVSQFSSKIDKIGKVLAAYAEGLELVETKIFTARRNITLQQKLYISQKPLSLAFRELSNLINSLDARNNLLVGAILNSLFLWDFKYVMKIVQWKSKYAESILIAFDVIAEMEALNSLAILKRNRPTWVTPILLDNLLKDRISAEAIAHPLIPASHVVVNDYQAKSHTIALITGSNMAGKSTFLRTVGANAVLAYAGGVVCAVSFKLPIYHLISYMRIKDSLNESTSTFKAELDRMKFILETVARRDDCFFLIDEMLRGTNSVDKYLGSRAIIRKLIEQDGKGMVATHDLQLASLEEENPAKIKNFHFDIQVIENEMQFDYKLKDGRCTIFNASLLLKGIGIHVEKA